MKWGIVRLVIVVVSVMGAAAAEPRIPMNSLFVTSTPVTGIPIGFTVDSLSQGSPATPFGNDYEDGAAIQLSAPATYQGRSFVEWQRNGSTLTGDPTVVFELSADYTLVAVYGPPKFKLTVQSTPDEGVVMLNEDIWEFATPYQREFDSEDPYDAIVRAPLLHNGRPFSSWLLDGEHHSDFHIAYLTMNKDHTLIAQYGTGSIRVKIQPREARRNKARWRVDGGPWLKKGTTVEGLSIGKHLVEWRPVPGFTTPKPRNVPIEADALRVIRGRYFPPE
ncbi:MAG: hypothetical protein AMXMBFR4_09400 [Candidatus Hydrogenedentota bacterium]